MRGGHDQSLSVVQSISIMAVIAWMAGLFYLPRLFVYHAGAATGRRLSETFKVMERRLAGMIMAAGSYS